MAWSAMFSPIGAVEPPPPQEVLLEPNVVVLTSPSCSFCGRTSVGDLSGRAKQPWSTTVQARRQWTCFGENKVGKERSR
jgi:hypothetical protein